MLKFFKIKDTGLVSVTRVSEDGKKERLAIIGQVDELLRREIIFPDNTGENMDKWLMIDKAQAITEYPSKEAAKEATREVYGE
jgi:hypothetical protein